MNTNYLIKKKKFHSNVVFSFKTYFSFSFCSDFNQEATVVKTDEIRVLKLLFTPCFLVIGKKKFSKVINRA